MPVDSRDSDSRILRYLRVLSTAETETVIETVTVTPGCESSLVFKASQSISVFNIYP